MPVPDDVPSKLRAIATTLVSQPTDEVIAAGKHQGQRMTFLLRREWKEGLAVDAEQGSPTS